jgi:hypothetical protein
VDAKAQFRSLAKPWADTGTSTGQTPHGRGDRPTLSSLLPLDEARRRAFSPRAPKHQRAAGAVDPPQAL